MTMVLFVAADAATDDTDDDDSHHVVLSVVTAAALHCSTEILFAHKRTHYGEINEWTNS